MVEGWNKTELGELFEIIAGQAPHSRYYNHNNEGVPFLKVNNFGVKYPVVDTWTTKSLRESKEGDILLSVAGSLGFVNYAINASITRSIFALRPNKKVDEDYLFHLLKSISKKLELIGSGSAQRIISKPVLNNFEISFPESLQEQQKIADILTKVDETIEATENIIVKDERIKKGLMQDLFSKGIDEKGNLRSEETHEFKDSELGRIPIEWDVDSAINYLDIINGGTPKTNNKEYWGGTIGWLSVDDFNHKGRYVFNSSKKITEKGLKNSSTKILKKNMLIISARGTVGVLAQIGYEMAFNQSCYGLNSKRKDLLNDYVYYQLFYKILKVKGLTHGGVFETITKNTFKEIILTKPLSEEQKQIASILSSIDSKIQREKQELNKLKSIKEGLMQDLLTGKVRVNHLLEAVT